MYNMLFLILAINIGAFVLGLDPCNSQYSLEIDLEPSDCPEGYYYFHNGDNCFPKCVEVTTNLKDCSTKPCPPGYNCVNNKCAIDEESCMKYHYNDKSNPYSKAMWKPTCNKDGTWAAKQCKGEVANGICYCYDAVGNRIYGQEWSNMANNMTCSCSRRRADLEKDKTRPYITLHCDTRGNYEPLQCESGQCFCVEPLTGKLTSPVVPEGMMKYLPCYVKIDIGESYLRQCESHAFAQATVKKELNIHGTEKVNMPKVVCDGDGAYGPLLIQGNNVYCIWKDQSRIGTWQSDASDESMDCNCARDNKFYEAAGKTLHLICQSNGNYYFYQRASTNEGLKYYCVYSDGFRKSPNIDSIPDLAYCNTFR